MKPGQQPCDYSGEKEKPPVMGGAAIIVSLTPQGYETGKDSQAQGQPKEACSLRQEHVADEVRPIQTIRRVTGVVNIKRSCVSEKVNDPNPAIEEEQSRRDTCAP